MGGQRICVGKTFAEIVSKIVGPVFLYMFDLELEKEMNEKEPLNSNNLYEPKIFGKLKIINEIIT